MQAGFQNHPGGSEDGLRGKFIESAFQVFNIGLMPSPTIAGVFGMARTIFRGQPNCCSSQARLFPGAIDTMTQARRTLPRMAAMTSSQI